MVGFASLSASLRLAWQGRRQQGEDVLLFPNSTATYDVPRSAWFRVDVLMIDDIPANRPFEIGIAVAPPAASR